MDERFFEIKDFDSGGKIGKIKLGNKEMITPNLFPVVNPFENLVAPKKLYDHFGARCLFTNAYILYRKREKYPDIIEKGLHKHLNFDGIIATDSGGFQDYMYADDINMQPETIHSFQEQIGSDCPVILDIPVQTTDTHEEAARKIDITIARAQESINQRTRSDTAWFGPVHGSIYPDLVKKSATEMSKLDFGIYAIGGVVKTFIDYRFELGMSFLLESKKYLRVDRPVHVFGLGLPAFFSLAVLCGADTFDSAAYILYAKDGRYFTEMGTKTLDKLTEFPCHCPVCSSYTPKEMRSQSKNEITRLLAEHNLYHSFSELRAIRQAIEEGRLWELVETRGQLHPKLLRALNVIKKYPDYFDKLLNLQKNSGQKYLRDISFHRPVFRNYRNNTIGYKIPANRKNLVILPELDLPGENGLSLRKWIKDIFNYNVKLKKDKDTENEPLYQICIVSNLLGIIPWELSQIYPAAQHEGSGDMQKEFEQRKILLDNMNEFITRNMNTIEAIKFLIPHTYINEYKVEEDFEGDNHIITYIMEDINKKYSTIRISQYTTIEDLLGVEERD